MRTSPFLSAATPLQRVMLKVLAALLPGIALQVWLFGIGVLAQLALASVAALATEALCLKLRGYPVRRFVSDGSALVCAWLLALSLPPLAPWWLAVLGSMFAIALGKQVYGGLGQNTFNPAMVGFVVLIVSFPAQMSHWAAPLAAGPAYLDASAQLAHIFGGVLPHGIGFDALASATPLDAARTAVRQGLPGPDGMLGGTSAWLALGWLVGGLFLLQQRLIPWQLPCGFLGALAVLAALFHWADPAAHAGALFHLGSGAALLGAFFIVTDPVTAPTTARGRIIYAASAGALTYLIRAFGNFPDGVAFAVLIMNMATPLLDQLTQPPVFGRKAGRAGRS
ncbi:RnfABCDGE type electron transport complex subunit D [Chitiniphilus purpureus]|uniref:Ion-translocating oxidoreductase complex subunit D n=1 Tax=Chitiniphilus purpureus TaxID=2981137 RepID=A0ABY6DH45_9NEIS|nr:RnfABCDGE type electron transport complex subunit D [Chitiniphilus sp. CD1]UXY13636.1 RnfABCDGE type electron transport complex subunit D [Chitiniphilus sp. CD1]